MNLRLDFAFPGDLRLPTGGYGYDRRVIAELRTLGAQVREISLPASFPFPSPDDLETSRRLLTNDQRDALIIDGLAFGALPEETIYALAPKPVALVHHPLCLETGLEPLRADALRASETRALAHAGAVLVTSRMTADIVARDFGVHASKLFAAEPGIDRAPRATGSSDGIVRLLSVGSLLPRKGYGDLLHALSGVTGEWSLTIVGSDELDPDCARSVKGLRAVLGLPARVALTGALPAEAVATHYLDADVFVTASHFEGYGMAIAEAIARGLPVVTTREVAVAGAAPTDAALVYPAGDVGALRERLSGIVGDAALRARLSDRAWAAAQAQPRWSDAAQTMLRAIEAARRAS
ncbi:MAG: glycosyltransferase family 4 protein [Beijerinckiaceae bacterium]